ncbi:TPA: replication initiation protein [Vibrio parahaemolyticus]|nr:replication initiation protein [Vibrio parahaemolyticus]
MTGSGVQNLSNNQPLRLNGQSKVQLTNTFSDLSVFPNIHSYRVCMSFLAVIPLDYACLEDETPENVIKYFRKKLTQDEDSLRFFIDFKDFLSSWELANPRKAKQMVKEHCLKELITTHIRCDDSTLRSVFEEVKTVDDTIVVWLNARAMPFLINAHLAKTGFMYRIPIELLKPFRSVYTVKIFERLVRFSDTGVLYMTPQSLKKLTDCKSEDYSTLRRDVLMKAEKELIKYGLLKKKFDIKTEKSGRKVSRIIIEFELTDKVRPPKEDLSGFVGNEEEYYEQEALIA